MLYYRSSISSFLPSARPLRYKTEFKELELLGKGSFGEVYRVQHLVDNQIYAVKRIRLNFDKVTRL